MTLLSQYASIVKVRILDIFQVRILDIFQGETMDIVKKVIIAYLFLINAIAFLSMYTDKRRAIKHKWRIPEKTLFLLAIIGGSIGSNLGMYTFRHKTKHWYFVVFMPIILIVQVFAGYFIFK